MLLLSEFILEIIKKEMKKSKGRKNRIEIKRACEKEQEMELDKDTTKNTA